MIYCSIYFEHPFTGVLSSDHYISSEEDFLSTIANTISATSTKSIVTFGAEATSNWYRLSVGTCKKEDIEAMLAALSNALAKLQ
mgnify:CR=1 FL=1